MKKKGYYEYIPHIYPRRLWVMYNTSEEEIDKFFTDMKGKPLVHNDEPMNEGYYGGMVYDECMFIFGKSFLKRMDGHVIALKGNVLGIGGINTKNTLSLCDIIISWEFAEYHSVTEKTILL